MKTSPLSAAFVESASRRAGGRPALARVGLALAALVSLVASVGCTQPGAAHESRGAAGQPPMRATVVTPTRKMLVRTIELPGRVDAFETAPVFAKVTGYVSSIAVDIGDVVKGPRDDQPGQLLCELLVPELEDDLAEKRAQIEFAKAQLLQADAAVKVAESGVVAATARVAEAKSSAAGEEARFNRWKSEYARVAELAEKGAVTRKVADETRAELDAADAGRQEVIARVASAEAQQQEAAAAVEKARADATAARARLAVAEAETRRAATLVEYGKIRAPFDGVVVERRVHTGWLVTAGGTAGGAAMFTVVKADPARIVVDVPEGDAVYVDRGTKIELRIPSLPGEPLVGKVARTSWSLNTAARTLTAEIDAPNPDRKWRPGLYVRANVTVAELPNALALPKTAIVAHDKRNWVYCVADGKIVRKPVVLGLQAGTDVEIREGLVGDEKVVAANAGAFREGQTVEAVTAPPAPPAAAPAGAGASPAGTGATAAPTSAATPAGTPPAAK